MAGDFTESSHSDGAFISAKRAVKQIATDMGFSPEQCVVLHDDLSLPLGIVKTKLNGSDGGHRGLVSLLDAFQRDTFRRVKIGIAGPQGKLASAASVISAWHAEATIAVAQAQGLAAQRVLELLTLPQPQHRHAVTSPNVRHVP